MGTRSVSGGNGPLTIPAIAGCCGGFVVIGALQALYGPAIPAFRTRFGVSPSVAGLALSAEFTGALVGIVIYHLLRPLAGDRRLLVICYAVMALGASLFAISPQWPMALAASLITGFGSGGIDYGLNRLFATGFGRRSTAMLNLLNAHFGVGAVVGPVLIGAVGAARFPWLFGGVAAASLLLNPTLRGVRPDPAHERRRPGVRTAQRGPAAGERPGVIGPAGSSPAPPRRPPRRRARSRSRARIRSTACTTAGRTAWSRIRRSSGPSTAYRLSRRRTPGRPGEPPATRGRTGLIVVAFVAIYVLYVAIESGVGGWEPTHLEAAGYSAAVAATATSGFWLALAIGRFAAVPVTLRWPGPDRHPLLSRHGRVLAAGGDPGRRAVGVRRAGAVVRPNLGHRPAVAGARRAEGHRGQRLRDGLLDGGRDRLPAVAGLGHRDRRCPFRSADPVHPGRRLHRDQRLAPPRHPGQPRMIGAGWVRYDSSRA